MKITIGCDPEVFVRNKRNFVSGHELIPGTKAHPYKVPNGAVQVDGMALEFNIDPAKNQEEFVYNVEFLLNVLKEMIPNNLKIAIEPVAHFKENYMEKQPAISKLLGCEPDFNAYTGNANDAPEEHPTMRTAAGHIHIGWNKNNKKFDITHIEECQALVKELDYTLGIPSLLIDGNSERRKMYGQAGSYRPKPYGVEYRVLSNFWLKKELLIGWVYQQTYDTIINLMTKKYISYYSKYGELAKYIINNNDIKKAKMFEDDNDK